MKRLVTELCVLLCVLGLCGCVGKSDERITIGEENITEEKLVIEGISGEYDLLFLTDTHMVVSSTEDSPQIAENAEERAPQFMDDAGVSSALQFGAWMDYANEKEVAAVLLGGDIIDFPSSAMVEHLNRNLDRLEMPYIYTLGNHDWTFPWEYMTEAGKEAFLPLFEPLMQGNTAINRMDIGELTIVSVDNSTNQVNGEALEQYQEILNEGRPVIVITHVPFMTQSVLGRAREVWSSPVVIGGGNFGGIYPEEESEKFLELTTAADSPVVAVLAGHVHFYDRDYIEGEKKILQLVGDGGFKRSGMLLHVVGKE